MSHTIKPVKKDNQSSPSPSSPANQNSSQPQDSTSEPVSLLSDADYEFLFNQLLEGIAHGWHDRRIIRFFQQLEERGKPEGWVAWLERLQLKVINLPLQSKRQLGTMMIRLGELTQAATEIQLIGTTSMRLGRELLFGNIENLIWEYAGPDLTIDTPPPATTENISQRLPEDFADLGVNTHEDTNLEISSNTTNIPTAKSQASSEDLPLLVLEDLIPDETNESKEISSVLSDPIESESTQENTLDNLEELTLQLPSETELEPFPETIPVASSVNLNQPTTPTSLSAETSESPENNAPEIIKDLDSESDFEFETSEPSAIATPPETKSADSDPVAIDMERVMNLIQEDEQLAQEITQKLNYSLTNQPESQNQTEIATPKSPTDLASDSLDQSSIELIEGWFNLGLKQVSAGEFAKAIASWEKALNINPHLSEAWHNRGSALGRLGKYQEAVVSFQKALRIDPNNYQAWNDRAHALYQLQEWSAAADSWSNAIKLTPGNHLFWYNRGCALEQLESWAESIASYEKSLEIKPDFQPARTRYTNLIADNSRSN